MQIMYIFGIWWKFLWETIYSVGIRLISDSPMMMIRGSQNQMCLMEGPEVLEVKAVKCTPDDKSAECQSGCEQINDNNAVGATVGRIEEAAVPEPVGPSKSEVSSSSSGCQMCPDLAETEQTLDCINELGICALHNTSKERGIISDTLKKLIGSMEPMDVSNRPATKPDSSRNAAAINLRFCCYKVVEDVARESGMKITSHDKSWDVVWYSRPVTEARCASFSELQRANYFPESQRAVWKNNLALCLTKMSETFPVEYDFFPKSWSLPRDWHLMEKHARRRPKDWFIVKPNNWGCGYGIYLTSEVSKLSNCGRVTSQVYIQKPLLIDGLKFDLRIYVLVTSCKPLRIFVFKEGLARFATDKYQEPDHQNKTNRYMHLTNYAVNKYSPSYVVDETTGTLRRWTTVSEWLTEHKIDSKIILASMDDVIVKTVIAMTPTLKYHYFRSFPDQADSNSCFQIFGFDIMLGSDLKVYVLEVNGSPQFYADVPLDVEMTKDLIRDTFDILNLAENPRNSPARKKTSWMAKKRDSRTITQRRVEWENSHLGGFRKIYPNERKKYKKFMRAADHFIRPL